MWIFMFLCDLLCPLIMVIAGMSFLKGGPKKLNSLCGYRTEMSMKNEETWRFAHRYCGKLWLIWGAVMLVITVILFLFLLGQSETAVVVVGLIACFLQCAVLIASIFPTEAALKTHFDVNGNQKK